MKKENTPLQNITDIILTLIQDENYNNLLSSGIEDSIDGVLNVIINRLKFTEKYSTYFLNLRKLEQQEKNLLMQKECTKQHYSTPILLDFIVNEKLKQDTIYVIEIYENKNITTTPKFDLCYIAVDNLIIKASFNTKYISLFTPENITEKDFIKYFNDKNILSTLYKSLDILNVFLCMLSPVHIANIMGLVYTEKLSEELFKII